MQSTIPIAQKPVSDKRKFSRDDWLAAGFSTLAKKGHGALSVEPIARAMGVSKGSFYHHFKDLPAFKIALLDFWQKKATDQVIRAASTENVPAKAKLLATVESSIETYDHPGGPNSEPAIRNWARHDASAYQRQIEVDVRRLVYVQDLFEELGFAPPEAETRASLLYSALIGLETLAADGAIRDAKPLRFLIQNLCRA